MGPSESDLESLPTAHLKLAGGSGRSQLCILRRLKTFTRVGWMTKNNQIYRYDIFSSLAGAFIDNLRQRDCFKMQNRDTNSRGSCLFTLDIASFLEGFCVLATEDVDAVEPKHPWRHQTSLIRDRRVPKEVRLGIFTHTRIWPQIREHEISDFATTK